MDGKSAGDTLSQPVEAESLDDQEQNEFEPVSSSVDEFDMLRKLFSTLKDVASQNVQHFESRPIVSDSNECFHALFTNIVTSAESVELLCGPLMEQAGQFDCNPATHANGFRSLLHMVSAVVSGLVKQSNFCKNNWTSSFFFSSNALELLSAQAAALKGLARLVLLAQDLLEHLKGGNLFPDSKELAEGFLARSQTIPRECFYGQCLGIHYVPSIKPVVQSISVAMATFGEGFLRQQNGPQRKSFANSVRVAMSTVWRGTGFALNHARRASQIVSLTQSRDIHFTKAFWSLAEVSAMQHMAELVTPSCAVNKLLTLPAEVMLVQCVAPVHGDSCRGVLLDVDQITTPTSAVLVSPAETGAEGVVADEDITPPSEISDSEVATAVANDAAAGSDENCESARALQPSSSGEFVHCELSPECNANTGDSGVGNGGDSTLPDGSGATPAAPITAAPVPSQCSNTSNSSTIEASNSASSQTAEEVFPEQSGSSEQGTAQSIAPPQTQTKRCLSSLDSASSVPSGLRRPVATSAQASSSTAVPSTCSCAEQRCTVRIPPPNMHDGSPASVNIHLISAVVREGMDAQPPKLAFKRNRRHLAPMAKGLVIHCHGGGFVATTTKSHQSYLRQWSIDLGVPVVSIDYSLAPEHPYPRAICDCLYAYAWILKNASLLGTTAEKIVITGDSAGGNLAVALTLACIELGIRKPDAVMAAYAPFLVELSLSPSRLLSVFDPLLPQGVLLACLDAYAGGSGQGTSCSSACQSTTNVSPESLAQTASQVASEVASNLGQLSFSSVATSVSKSVGWNAGGGMSVQWSRASSSPPLDGDGDGGHSGAGAPVSDEDPPPYETVQPMPSSNAAPEHADEAAAPEHADEADFVELSYEDANSLQGASLPSLNSFQQEVFGKQPSPFLSPLRASDEMLTQLPHVDLVACALDPLLDDSVAFGKRLSALNVACHLHVADSLPHGFLNLAFISKEAHRAYDLCTQCMRNALAG